MPFQYWSIEKGIYFFSCENGRNKPFIWYFREPKPELIPPVYLNTKLGHIDMTKTLKKWPHLQNRERDNILYSIIIRCEY